MPGRPTFCVQVFERSDGGLIPLRRINVASAAEATAMAEAMVPTMPGTAALCLTVGDDGRVWTITVLGKFGEVPEPLAEVLLDG